MDARSQLLMPIEVVWFSLFSVLGLALHAAFPEVKHEQGPVGWAMNTLVLKQVGYFLPLVCVQLFHFFQSRQTFFRDFVCTDLIGWLYVYTFTRFLFEPAIHVVSSTLFGRSVLLEVAC